MQACILEDKYTCYESETGRVNNESSKRHLQGIPICVQLRFGQIISDWTRYALQSDVAGRHLAASARGRTFLCPTSWRSDNNFVGCDICINHESEGALGHNSVQLCKICTRAMN
jgi:hypothetical protein